jgi:hypothetical protein
MKIRAEGIEKTGVHVIELAAKDLKAFFAQFPTARRAQTAFPID